MSHVVVQLHHAADGSVSHVLDESLVRWLGDSHIRSFKWTGQSCVKRIGESCVRCAGKSARSFTCQVTQVTSRSRVGSWPCRNFYFENCNSYF